MTHPVLSSSSKPRRFFGLLCRHEWEILARYESKARALGTDPLDDRSWHPIGTSYDMHCKHCGWIKRVEA